MTPFPLPNRGLTVGRAKKSRKRTDKDRARDNQGPRVKPTTPLYVRCPQCGASEVGLRGDCVCLNGYVETGFTQERFDSLLKENDRMLIFLDSCNKYPGEAGTDIREFVENPVVQEKIEGARSRTKRTA